ncbi:GWxTD domain-containing protein, partial [candidate division WOR-3 bacterium]|nr:GWxTD domain-containing protein [candidate division WOR-3 bacterium]
TNWESRSIISKMEEINQKLSLIDNASFILSPGEYEFTYIIEDKQSNNKMSKKDTIILDNIEDTPFMSNILLGLSLKVDSTNSKFARNGYTIIPHPSHHTTNLNPFLIIYAEFYNFIEGKDYAIDYFITNDNGDTIMNLAGKRDITIGDAFFNVGGINTIGLKDGTYNLIVSITADNLILSKKQRISKSSFLTNIVTSKYDLTDKQLEYYGMIKYIVSESQLKQYNKLNKIGKHNFLLKFWESRDVNPNNNKLEALDKHIKNIEFVNKRFSSGLQEGYESDRGRIYIKYGSPDEELIIPSSRNLMSCENWIYYSGGGMQYIFADIKGFGKFELLYTNNIQENIPVNWSNYLDLDIIKFSRN